MKIAVIYGSRSDKEIMSKAGTLLEEFGVEVKEYILSAHRIPEKLGQCIKKLEDEGCECFIAGAGLSAHLPGVIASKTIKPVIGVPIKCELGGMDSLLSIVQMPKSIPVATVGINNSFNAAMTALEILGIKYPSIESKLIEYRKEMKEKFIKDSGLEEV